jgi:hypothetical protein
VTVRGIATAMTIAAAMRFLNVVYRVASPNSRTAYPFRKTENPLMHAAPNASTRPTLRSRIAGD